MAQHPPRMTNQRRGASPPPALVRLLAPLTRFPLLVGAGAGLVICALGLIALTALSPRTTPPDAAARALCADLRTQRYDDLYTQLSPDLRGTGTQAQFVASQRQLDLIAGPVTGCAYTLHSTSAADATLQLEITRAKAAPASGSVSLVRLSGAWLIAAYDASVV